MGVWSRVRQGLGATKRRAADRDTTLPTFEKLEPRILLSADPLGLADDDPYRDGALTESAIVVDFAEFDYTEPASEKVQGASAGEPTMDGPDQTTPDEQAISSDLNALSLSQVQRAASLSDT